MDYFVESAKPRTLGQSMKGRIIGGQGDAHLLGWFNGFTTTKAGNFIGSFFLAKKASDIVITARITLFRSDRTTRPGCPWTWSIQITDGPRRMIAERPSYSNFYFEDPYKAAISVYDDLRGGGYVQTQPKRSSIIAAIAKEQANVERVGDTEVRIFKTRERPIRTIDT